MDVLILWDDSKSVASTVISHVESIKNYSVNRVYLFDMFGDIPESLDLNRFDAVVVHYSLVLCSKKYVSLSLLDRLRCYSGVKCVFIQDEYRHVNKTIEAMLYIGVDIIFTCVPKSEINKVYPDHIFPDVLKVNVLTGYVDSSLLDYRVPQYSDRLIDIGYRARKPPAYLGELGQEKWHIGRIVADDAKKMNLKVDLAYREEERLYGDAWLKFVSNCKAVLGVESGASVFDFTGDVVANVTAALKNNPNLKFAELQQRFFSKLEGAIKLNQISPRCFEAAALKTLMILYEGEYSGRLKPWRHYLPLKKDHSNFSEIVSYLKDEKKALEIINNAYAEVALNPDNSFKAMVNIFDNAIEQKFLVSSKLLHLSYTDDEFYKVQRVAHKVNFKSKCKRKIILFTYVFIFKYLMFFFSERKRDNVHKWLVKNIRFF
jgi:hypothetical protein